MNVDCLMCGQSHDGSATSCPVSRRVGSTIGDRYRLLAVAGVGGMGVVYRAEHLRLGVPRAIKVLHHRFNGESGIMRRFVQEARTSVLLHHPNVVAVHDCGVTDDGCPYLDMEWLDGLSLRKATKWSPGGRIPVREAVRIVVEVLRILAEIHASDIVHRDLKPDNLFITRIRRGSHTHHELKILDLGIAKLLNRIGDDSITRVGEILGTPHYMSPEQLERFGEVRSAADLYSMAAVLLFLLTGRPPRGAKEVGLIFQQLEKEAERQENERRPVRLPELERAITSALALAPADRPQSALEMATLLQACVDGEHEPSLESFLASFDALINEQPADVALDHQINGTHSEISFVPSDLLSSGPISRNASSNAASDSDVVFGAPAEGKAVGAASDPAVSTGEQCRAVANFGGLLKAPPDSHLWSSSSPLRWTQFPILVLLCAVALSVGYHRLTHEWPSGPVLRDGGTVKILSSGVSVSREPDPLEVRPAPRNGDGNPTVVAAPTSQASEQVIRPAQGTAPGAGRPKTRRTWGYGTRQAVVRLPSSDDSAQEKPHGTTPAVDSAQQTVEPERSREADNSREAEDAGVGSGPGSIDPINVSPWGGFEPIPAMVPKPFELIEP